MGSFNDVLVQFDREYIAILTYIALIFFILTIKQFNKILNSLEIYVPESIIFVFLGFFVNSFFKVDEYLMDSVSLWRITIPLMIIEATYFIAPKNSVHLILGSVLFGVLGTVIAFTSIIPVIYSMDFHIEDAKDKIPIILIIASIFSLTDNHIIYNLRYLLGTESLVVTVLTSEMIVNHGIILSIILQFIDQLDPGYKQSPQYHFYILLMILSILVGVCSGMLSTMVVKYLEIYQFLLLVLLAQISYTFSVMCGLSGVICLYLCCLFQANYAFHNMKAINIKMTKIMIKNITFIFQSLLLCNSGAKLALVEKKFELKFLILTAACIFIRFLIVCAFYFIINKKLREVIYLKKIHLFFLSMIGYKSSIGLITTSFIQDELNEVAKLFQMTMLHLILIELFLSFVFNAIFRNSNAVKLEEKHILSLFDEINNLLIFNTKVLIEVITNENGFTYYNREFHNFIYHYFYPILLRRGEYPKPKLSRIYNKITTLLNVATIYPERANTILIQVPKNITKKYTVHEETPKQVRKLEISEEAFFKNSSHISVLDKIDQGEDVLSTESATILMNRPSYGTLSRSFEDSHVKFYYDSIINRIRSISRIKKISNKIIPEDK